MPKTANAVAMDALQKELGPVFKARGYRKRARNYARQASDGLSHCIQFQMGKDPFDEASGFGEPLSGTFTINIGVFVPEIAEMQYYWVTIKFPTEVYCAFRLRVGNLLDPSTDADIWYDIPDATGRGVMVDHLREIFEQTIFPFLEQLETRDDYLRAIRLGMDHASPFKSMIKEDGAIICATRGDTDQALEFLALSCDVDTLWEDRPADSILNILGVPEISREETQKGAIEDARKLAKKLGLTFNPEP